MWNAPSDRDYYGPSEAEERGECEDDPLDAFTDDEISLMMSEPPAGACFGEPESDLEWFRRRVA